MHWPILSHVPDTPRIHPVAEFADQLNLGLIVLDSDGCVSLWNRWIERYSGVPSPAACGLALNDLMSIPQQLSLALEAAHRGFARVLSPALNRIGLPLRDPRRGSGSVQQRLVLSPWQGGVLIEIHDVSAAWVREQELQSRAMTWRSEAETLAASAAEMQKALEARSQFFASMSHELRSPLNAIIGFAQMLQITDCGHFTDKHRDYINSLMAGGRHLLLMIDEVLDMARLEAGHLDLVDDEALPGDLIANVLDRIAPIAMSKRILTRVETFISTRVSLRCDVRLTERMLTNLLSNAYKFSLAGGLVIIRLEQTLDGALTIAVIDHGPGIPHDRIADMLVPYGQTAQGRRAGGTGLGLPVVAEGMQLHGGRLDIDSDLGRGLTARMIFPLARTRLRNSDEVSGLAALTTPER